MPSIEERENLMTSPEPKRSGFTARPAEKLVTRKLPRSMLKVECNHFLRASSQEATHGYKPLPYKLWMEAGKHPPPLPDRPDSQFNSNVWRNFRKHYGIKTTTEGDSVSEMIAAMYPLNVPKPSRVGGSDYAKFLRESHLIKDPKYKKFVIERVETDIDQFRKLRLKSDSRNPPLDQTGNIEPPVNFKKHAYKFVPPPELPPESPRPPGETRIDIFGNEVPKLPDRDPYMWKLAHRLNAPNYKQVQEETERRRAMPREHPPFFMTTKVS